MASFDHPSDTMLPGMKLGWSLKTGLQRNLTSWRSDDDPSPGDFSYRMDISVLPYLIVDAVSSIKHRSGPWTGQEFNGVHVLDNLIYKAVFVDKKDEVFVLYESNSKEVITRVTLSHSGSLQHLTLKKGSSEWGNCTQSPVTIVKSMGIAALMASAELARRGFVSI